MSYSAATIANYFIKKYATTGELTPLKLIKLVYVSYGWYLETFEDKEPLVNEKPQAWRYGPVFPSLYYNLKQHGKSFVKEPVNCHSTEIITDEDARFLDKVWEIYGQKDGIYLSALTHKDGTPWSETYPKGENLIIPDPLIKEYYKKLLE
ncbi:MULTISPECIES: type II toxin-antitoxin system antitoxin SocA domain-containing protein [unclassified Flavobacterium]|uniref:Panacea domain-containing protein n=1 Tax=unclassified Flavobacterium TaxID=196869 RepID=UPI0026386B8A|nr:type II toxin-antitoxin system antitoxin SocA domain-containing protein [Flavobacterium sp.]